MICGSGGSKSRLTKAAGAEPVGQMRVAKVHTVVARSTFQSQKWKKTDGFGALLEVKMSKKCTLLWREARLQLKKLKTHHVRTTFGIGNVEKVHAVVVRSTFPSQNVQSTPCSDHFWKLRCRKSARRCGAKHISKSKNWRVWSTFGRADVVSRGRRKGLCTLSKVSNTWGFCSSFKKDSRRGTFEEDLQRCIFRGRRSTRDMLGGPGADFLREVAFWSIRSSVLGRWFCVTGAALRMTWHHFFVASTVL